MKKSVIGIVFKKELLDIFRDRKTVIFSILLPLLILPIISFFIGMVANNSEKKVENNLKVTIVDQGQSNFGAFLKAQKNIKLVASKDIKQDVKDGKIFAAITIPAGFDESIDKDNNQNITLTYDNSSSDAITAVSIINTYINNYSKQIVGNRLAKRNIDANILNPINVVEDTIEKKDSGVGKMIVTMILPLLLILYSITGTLASAVDLGAGEKERGTLEPLLTTKANRLSLLWGKFLAITVMGLIMSMASLAGMFITMQQKNGMFGGKGDFNLGAGTLVLIMILPILCTMVFGAFELAVSIYARSFKEAQTYLSPVTVVGMILVYATMMKDPKNIETFYFSIPITNAACLIKEFLVGIHNYAHIAITFGWMAVYIVAAILFARYMFSREDVIFRT
ncbi:MAG: ABC transporter permease [Bacillota bacterium]|nr:ABC transporter permease [Bacillota bacterium]